MLKKQKVNFDKDTILYHGTPNTFDEFDWDMIGSSSGNMGFLGKGFYFTKDPDIARAYGKLKKVTLNLENPLILNGILSNKTVDIINEASDSYAFDYDTTTHNDVFNGLSYAVISFPELAETISMNLETKGYDGVIYGDCREVVCFYTDDIKIVE